MGTAVLYILLTSLTFDLRLRAKNEL